MNKKPYKEHLHDKLKNLKAASAYLEEAIQDPDSRVLSLALRDIAEAQGEFQEFQV